MIISLRVVVFVPDDAKKTDCFCIQAHFAVKSNCCLCVIILPLAHVVVCIWMHLYVVGNVSGHCAVLSSWT